MQIILLLIVVSFITLPGIAFRLGYLKRDGLQILTETKLYIEILFIIFISLILHLGSWWVYETFCNGNFNIDLLYKILSGNNTIELEEQETQIGNFVVYNFILSLLVFLIGWCVNITLDKREVKFHQNFQFLDYTGNWDRILSYNREEKKKSVNTLIDALVEVNNQKIIYTGALVEYYIDSKGYIDKLILDNVVRISLEDYDALPQAKLKQSKPSKPQNKSLEDLKKVTSEKVETFNVENKFFKIPSHHFVLYGSTIKNVGIRYEKIPKNNVSIKNDETSNS